MIKSIFRLDPKNKPILENRSSFIKAKSLTLEFGANLASEKINWFLDLTYAWMDLERGQRSILDWGFMLSICSLRLSLSMAALLWPADSWLVELQCHRAGSGSTELTPAQPGPALQSSHSVSRPRLLIRRRSGHEGHEGPPNVLWLFAWCHVEWNIIWRDRSSMSGNVCHSFCATQVVDW